MLFLLSGFGFVSFFVFVSWLVFLFVFLPPTYDEIPNICEMELTVEYEDMILICSSPEEAARPRKVVSLERVLANRWNEQRSLPGRCSTADTAGRKKAHS